MATLRKDDEEKVEETPDNVAQVEPVPLELMYPPDEQVFTFTDPDLLTQNIPEIESELNARNSTGLKRDFKSSSEAIESSRLENSNIASGEASVSLLSEEYLFSPADHETLASLKADTVKNVTLYPLESLESETSVKPQKDTVKSAIEVEVVRIEPDKYTEINTLTSDSQVFEGSGHIAHDSIDLFHVVPYINQHLKTASNVLAIEIAEDSFSGSHSAFQFEKLVQDYQNAEMLVDSCVSELDSKFHHCFVSMSDVWIKRTGVSEQKQHVREKTEASVAQNDFQRFVRAQVTFSHAEFSLSKFKLFENFLKGFVSLKTEKLPQVGFDCAMAMFAAENRIISKMAESSIFNPSLAKSSLNSSLASSETVDNLRTLQIYFSVLVSFYRQSASVEFKKIQWRSRFLRSVKTWICHIGSGLLHSGRFDDRVFLMEKVVQSFDSGASLIEKRWIIHLLQILPPFGVDDLKINADDRAIVFSRLPESELDCCVAMFEVLLQLFSKSSSVSCRAQNQLNDNTAFSQKKPGKRYETSSLNDIDCVTLLKQVMLQDFVWGLCLSMEHIACLPEEGFSRMLARVLHVMNIFCDTIEKLQLVYPNLSEYIVAQGVLPLIERMAIVLDSLDGDKDANKALNKEISFRFYGATKRTFNALFMRMAYVMFRRENPCNFIRSLRFDRLSRDYLFRLFICLLTGYVGKEGFIVDRMYTDDQELGSRSSEEDTQLSKDDWPTLADIAPEKWDCISAASSLFLKHKFVTSRQAWRHHAANRFSIRKQFLTLLQRKELVSIEDENSRNAFRNQDISQWNCRDRISTLSKIASSAKCYDIAVEILVEILGALLFVPNSQFLLRSSEVYQSIGRICTAWPSLISTVLQFFSCDFVAPRPVLVNLLEVLPFAEWKPSSRREIDLIASWLLQPIFHVDTVLLELTQNRLLCAMEALKRLQWRFLPPTDRCDLVSVVVHAYIQNTRDDHKPMTEAKAQILSSVRGYVPYTSEYRQRRETKDLVIRFWDIFLSIEFLDSSSFASDGTMLGGRWLNLSRQFRKSWDDNTLILKETLSATKRNFFVFDDSGSLNEVFSTVDPVLAYIFLMSSNISCVEDSRIAFGSLLYFAVKKKPGEEFRRAQEAFCRVIFFLVPYIASCGESKEENGLLLPPRRWLKYVMPGANSGGFITGFLHGLANRSLGIGSKGISSSTALTASAASSTVSDMKNLQEDISDVVLSRIWVSDNQARKQIVVFWTNGIVSCEGWMSNTELRALLDSIIRLCYFLDSFCSEKELVATMSAELANYFEEKNRTDQEEDIKDFGIPGGAIRTYAKLWRENSDIDFDMSSSYWLLFHILLIKTGREYALWCTLGNFLTKMENLDKQVVAISKEYERLLESSNSLWDKTRSFLGRQENRFLLSNMVIYRWAQALCCIDPCHPLCMLFWQVFLALFFTRINGVMFAYRFFYKMQDVEWPSLLLSKLIMRAKYLSARYAKLSHEETLPDKCSMLMKKSSLFASVCDWISESNPNDIIDDLIMMQSASSTVNLGGCTGSVEDILHDILNLPFLETLQNAVIGLKTPTEIYAVQNMLWLELTSFELDDKDSKSLSQKLKSLLGNFENSVLDKSNRNMDDTSSTRNTESFDFVAPPAYAFRSAFFPHDFVSNFRLAEEALPVFRDSAIEHSRKINEYRDSVKDLLGFLPKLYVAQKRKSVIEKPHLNRPDDIYRFEIAFNESVLDNHTQERIMALWETLKTSSFGWDWFLDGSNYSVRGGDDELSISHSSFFERSTSLLEDNDFQSCIYVNAVVATVDALISRVWQSARISLSSSEDAESNGASFFHACLSAEKGISREISPLQRVVWKSIAQLGAVFIRGNSKQASELISVMLDEKNLIRLLAPLISPPKHAIDFFSHLFMIWEALPSLNVDDAALILGRFNFLEWIALCPPKNVLLQAYWFSVGVLKDGRWKTKASHMEFKTNLVDSLSWDALSAAPSVFNYHAYSLFTLVSYDFDSFSGPFIESLFGQTYISRGPPMQTTRNVPWLHTALSSSFCKPMPLIIWDIFFCISEETWISLDFEKLEYLCEVVCDCFHSMYKSAAKEHNVGLIYWLAENGILERALELVRCIFSYMHRILKDTFDNQPHFCFDKGSRFWKKIADVYSPLLKSGICCDRDYTGSLNDVEDQHAAWSAEDYTFGRNVISSLIGRIQQLLTLYFDKAYILDNVLFFYFHVIIPNAPSHVIELVSSEFEAFSWEEWRLNEAFLKIFCDCVSLAEQDGPNKTIGFISALLARLSWRNTELGFSSDASQPNICRYLQPPIGEVVSQIGIDQFYASVLQLSLRVLLIQKSPLPPSLSSFFNSIVPGLCWKFVSPEDYVSTVAMISSKLSPNKDSPEAVLTQIEKNEFGDFVYLDEKGQRVFLSLQILLGATDLANVFSSRFTKRDHNTARVIRALQCARHFFSFLRKPFESLAGSLWDLDETHFGDHRFQQMPFINMSFFMMERDLLPVSPTLLIWFMHRLFALVARLFNKITTLSNICVAKYSDIFDAESRMLHTNVSLFLKEVLVLLESPGVGLIDPNFIASVSLATDSHIRRRAAKFGDSLSRTVSTAYHSLTSAVGTSFDHPVSSVNKDEKLPLAGGGKYEIDLDLKAILLVMNAIVHCTALTDTTLPKGKTSSTVFSDLARSFQEVVNPVKQSSNKLGRQNDHRLLISGAACGAALFLFLQEVRRFLPMMLSLKKPTSIFSVVSDVHLFEVCTENWASSTVVKDFALFWKHNSSCDDGSIRTYAREAAAFYGAWKTCYILLLHEICLSKANMRISAEMVSSTIVLCSKATQENHNSRLPFVPIKLLPMVALFFEIIVLIDTDLDLVRKELEAVVITLSKLAFGNKSQLFSIVSEAITSLPNRLFNPKEKSNDKVSDQTRNKDQVIESEASRFDLYLVSILAFVCRRCEQGTGALRLKPASKLPYSSSNSEALLSELGNFSKNDSTALWAYNFCRDEERPLSDVILMISKLNAMLFPADEWMQRPRQEWKELMKLSQGVEL